MSRNVCRGVALAVVLFALVAPSAGADGGTGGTAPAYPRNTLALEQIAPIVAGTTTKVELSGHAQWNEPTDDLTIPYTLSVYVQNADVDPRCETSKSAQLQKAINVATLGASETITDFVLDDDFSVRPAPPNPGIDWSIDSLPFVVTPGVSHVLLCGYQRYVTDDVAWYQLPVTVSQPTCSLASAVVRRGRAIPISCNFTGAVSVRFRRGGRARAKAARVGAGGKGRVSTAGLARGSYRVSIVSGRVSVRVAKRRTVRVR
jgi:hypothetical protein